MSNQYLSVPVTPSRKGDDTNVVLVTANYYPNSKCVSVAAYPAHRSGDLDQIAMTRLKHGERFPMPRLNRKKVDEIATQVYGQIKSRSGPAWNLVLDLCKENDLKPVATESTT